MLPPSPIRKPLPAFQAAQDRLSGVLGRLMMISEQYPELKSNTNFLALQSQLEGTENRIEIARRDYNAAVQAYNTTLVTLPGSLWASMVHRGYKQATPFVASAAAQQAPTVDFNNTMMMAPQQVAAPWRPDRAVRWRPSRAEPWPRNRPPQGQQRDGAATGRDAARHHGAAAGRESLNTSQQ